MHYAAQKRDCDRTIWATHKVARECSRIAQRQRWVAPPLPNRLQYAPPPLVTGKSPPAATPLRIKPVIAREQACATRVSHAVTGPATSLHSMPLRSGTTHPAVSLPTIGNSLSPLRASMIVTKRPCQNALQAYLPTKHYKEPCEYHINAVYKQYACSPSTLATLTSEASIYQKNKHKTL